MSTVSSEPAASTRHAGPMPTVTMIGGGQLARMTHQAAIALGQCLRVLAASPGDPAAVVSADVVIGSHENIDDLRRAAQGATALTFDHEGVPLEHLRTLEAEGVQVRPPSKALHFAQDKLAMRVRLAELGLPVPDFADLGGSDREAARTRLTEFGDTHDWSVVLKAVRGGYDGRGVWLTDTRDEALAVFDENFGKGAELIVEQKVPMRRELSALVARSPFGQGAAWPVVETVQRKGQCAVVLAPAPDLDEAVAEEAQQLSLRLAAELGVVGVMAMELFETVGEDGGPGRLVVNELAMRPHNSGHWTMDGAVTSQFEQHVRAVLDYPLGDTSPRAPVTVMANILGAEQAPSMSMDERLHHLFARMPEAKVHLYGKGERPDRKIGHVNIVGAADDGVEDVRERAERAAHWMSRAEWTDGWDPHS
ncbi:5-(carboxyamino)imidazole ribonucleotide synthase [Gordonia amarae]|nr:5-(carboxyamino)imidazole ribonucleotide synthase [Gordonia amarae]QHN21526.1 5-(carboxyamino)imidazole ribonucleotide synthase [Gordonia amarae]QHN30376.1 5-(carboxyamino)imidazole ribonucleotide synthase [Gordonia amarae]QHN39153.1 5-(carboxyamino)imidazole ribonucleotide synthase [Gordonia amarae]